MLDPLTSLAFNMQACPGIYALLIESGVSRAAGIPTGWEIVLDLIRRLSRSQREDCGPDPAAWYRAKFGRDHDYAGLLATIGGSPEERQQILRSYFEPSPEEREQALKQPTAAHRSIGGLGAAGYVPIILTTNFDRLLERAVEAAGVSPTVLSTPDDIEGAVPLVHQRCCIAKLHGDFLDVRIKNTLAELARYDERVDGFLDQVLDCFGLVVCGWSAQWDTALRSAIARYPSRRYTTYWATRGELTEEVARLVTQRAARVICIQDAEAFFPRLGELITAVAVSRQPHPTSVEGAIALTKRYLSDARYLIPLEEFVLREAQAAHEAVESYLFVGPTSKHSIATIFQACRDHVYILQAILMYGVTYGATPHDHLWGGHDATTMSPQSSRQARTAPE